MDRRDVLKKIGAAVGLMAIPPLLCAKTDDADGRATLRIQEEPQAIDGIGILRYPASLQYKADDGSIVDARQMAQALCENMVRGSILILPNDRNEHGQYQWDFRIEGGDPQQVRVQHLIPYAHLSGHDEQFDALLKQTDLNQ